MNLYRLDIHGNAIEVPYEETHKYRDEIYGSRRWSMMTQIDYVDVSTTFLGIDHRHGAASDTPILFETMIFGGKYDGYQRRYCTMAEAKTGHREAIEKVKNTPLWERVKCFPLNLNLKSND